jgi:hypothetical protein
MSMLFWLVVGKKCRDEKGDLHYKPNRMEGWLGEHLSRSGFVGQATEAKTELALRAASA